MKPKETKEEMFESIYRSYEKDVFRACLHLTMERELAREMTQQTFVNFYEHFDKVEIENVKAYLIRTARNVTYNYYRKTNRERKLDDDEDKSQTEEPTVESVEEQYFEDVRKMMRKELSGEILMDLKEQHEEWYDIIYRMFFKGMTHSEVAIELGITKDVLYSRLHRAKLWIQKNYREDFEKVR